MIMSAGGRRVRWKGLSEENHDEKHRKETEWRIREIKNMDLGKKRLGTGQKEEVCFLEAG